MHIPLLNDKGIYCDYAHWPPSEQAHALFYAAAAVLGEPVTALTHPQALDASLTSGIVKIDPPVHSETDIRKINAIGLDYIHFLQNMAARPGVTWLNHPAGLIHLLDKKRCKRRLLEHGIPTPPLVAEDVKSFAQLTAIMEEKGSPACSLSPRWVLARRALSLCAATPMA